MAMIDDPILGFVASVALPTAGAFFKNPIYGAVGGLAGGALHGLLNDHTGWDLVSDIAIGAAGGGFGAWIGRKGFESMLMGSKGGGTVGEALSRFTRFDRAIVTGASMGFAGNFTAMPLAFKEILSDNVLLPTVGIGNGDT